MCKIVPFYLLIPCTGQSPVTLFFSLVTATANEIHHPWFMTPSHRHGDPRLQAWPLFWCHPCLIMHTAINQPPDRKTTLTITHIGWSAARFPDTQQPRSLSSGPRQVRPVEHKAGILGRDNLGAS